MTVIKNRKSISASKKYYDDLAKAGYDAAKDYQQILFKPGKALQTRELNFLQSLLHEKIKNTNDITYKNGSVIFGCDVEIDEDTTNTITVGDGVVYWDGIFFKFSETTITTTELVVNGLNIHLVPKYETIDYNADAELYDPAILYKIDQSIDGADRLKITFDVAVEEEITNFDTTYPQSFQVANINDGGVSLMNRNPFIIENDKELDSEVKDGLRLRSNPMREPFTITDDNVDFYNTDSIEKAFVEIEEGSGVINGEEVVSSETKVFQIKKSDASSDSDKFTEEELKKTKIPNSDLVGIYGDISYGESFIDKKTFLVDSLQPGKNAKIKVRIPLKKTEDGVESIVYKIFEICQAQIADVFDLWKTEPYNKINNSDDPVIIGITPKPIDMISVPPNESTFIKTIVPVNGGTISTGNDTDIDLSTDDSKLATYNTLGVWTVELIAGWKIYIHEDHYSDWRNPAYWNKVEYIVAINALYDADGQSVLTAIDGLRLNLIDKGSSLLRSSADILKEGLIFNYDTSLPGISGTLPPWSNIDDDTGNLTFSFEEYPQVWENNGLILSGSTIQLQAANPFVIMGNLFTDDVIGPVENLPLNGVITTSGTKFDFTESSYELSDGSYNIKFTRDSTASNRLSSDSFKDIALASIDNSIADFSQATVWNLDASNIVNGSIDIGGAVKAIQDKQSIFADQGKNCILFHEFFTIERSAT